MEGKVPRGRTQRLQVTFFLDIVKKCNKSNHLTLSHRDSRRRGKITTGFVYSPWKSGFMRQHNIEMNWRVNPIRSPKVEIYLYCRLWQVIFQTLISLCCRC